eukprot:GHVU01132875.1.p2 GENE.GHVU01132875.1~~GHVU01132875.1.p2  ORF type:complete len:136 (+),score=3.62 GHVU01132875.1:350-757(+)
MAYAYHHRINISVHTFTHIHPTYARTGTHAHPHTHMHPTPRTYTNAHARAHGRTDAYAEVCATAAAAHWGTDRPPFENESPEVRLHVEALQEAVHVTGGPLVGEAGQLGAPLSPPHSRGIHENTEQHRCGHHDGS